MDESLRPIYERIAERDGITVQEVWDEMQNTIIQAYSNPPSAETAAFQQTVPHAGKFPTPDEMIRFIRAELLRQSIAEMQDDCPAFLDSNGFYNFA